MIVRENAEDLYAGIACRDPGEAAESIKSSPRRRIVASPSVRAQPWSPLRDGGAQGEHHEAQRRPSRCSPLRGRAIPRHRVQRPHRRQHVHAVGAAADEYDVLVMPNLYGDILSDLASGPAAWRAGRQHRQRDRCVRAGARLRPVRRAGQGESYRDDPSGTLLSGIWARPRPPMLWSAVAVIAAGEHVTYDLKPDRDIRPRWERGA